MEVYLGKTVLYKPRGGMRFYGHKLVALVTRVFDEDDRVNLAIFEPSGDLVPYPQNRIPLDQLEDVVQDRQESNALVQQAPPMPENFGIPPMGQVPNIPFDKSELPAGARMVEHRPATPEEIEAAKAGIGVPKVKSPRKPVKKPVKKPRKPKSGY
jgi:hypothetical protein